MRIVLATLLLGAVAFLSRPVVAPAQQTPQDNGELETPHPYVPPSAKQSVEIGNFYFSRKDYRGALSRYEESAHDDPYYAPAYLGLGKVYEKTGKPEKALDAYQKYLSVLPSKKQADQAKDVHKAIHQLEQQLAREQKSQAATHAPASAARK